MDLLLTDVFFRARAWFLLVSMVLMATRSPVELAMDLGVDPDVWRFHRIFSFCSLSVKELVRGAWMLPVTPSS